VESSLQLSRVPHTLLVLVGHTLPGVGLAHVTAQSGAKFEPTLTELALERQVIRVSSLRCLLRGEHLGKGLIGFRALHFGKIRIRFCFRFLSRSFQSRVSAKARRCVIQLRMDHEQAVVSSGQRLRVGLGTCLF